MLTLHAAGGVPGTDRRRVLSVRFLGDDIVHAPRPWATSPPFPGLADELPAGAPMDHPLFPVLWTVGAAMTDPARSPPSATRCCASAAREVTPDELAGDEIQRLIDDLIDTMHDANGAGIAANQVHEPVRIAVIEVDHNPRYPYKPPIPLTVVVNPVIEPLDDELVEINEGCLSVPNLRGNVMRHVNVRVRYLDRDGGEHDEVKRGPDRRHVPARVRPPRRPAVPRPGRRHDDADDVGAVRAPPPRRLRRPHHRVRRPGRVVDTVEHRPFAGLEVPVVGMGTSKTFDVADVDDARQQVTDAALDDGATFVDSSPMYGHAERILGATLGDRRGEAIVATKVWTPDDDEAERQIDASLALLRRPRRGVPGAQPRRVARPASTSSSARRDRGEVDVVAATHWQARAFDELETVMRTGRIGAIQVPYNPHEREVERRIFPLAAGARDRRHPDAPVRRRRARSGARPSAAELAPLAEFGVTTWPQALLKYGLSHPATSVSIPATTQPRADGRERRRRRRAVVRPGREGARRTPGRADHDDRRPNGRQYLSSGRGRGASSTTRGVHRPSPRALRVAAVLAATSSQRDVEVGARRGRSPRRWNRIASRDRLGTVEVGVLGQHGRPMLPPGERRPERTLTLVLVGWHVDAHLIDLLDHRRRAGPPRLGGIRQQNSRPAGERSTTTSSSLCSTAGAEAFGSLGEGGDVVGVQVEMAAARACGNPLHPQVGVAVGRDQRGELALLTTGRRQRRPSHRRPEGGRGVKGRRRPVEERGQPADRHRASVGTSDAMIARCSPSTTASWRGSAASRPSATCS